MQPIISLYDNSSETCLQISHLQEERDSLKTELARAVEFNSNSAENNLTGYMDDLRVSTPTLETSHSSETTSPLEERNRLRYQLSEATRELERFHKEMEGLSVQLNDMAVEMAESQTKVGVYSKRLAEVEHSLATTQEMNVNLQILLEKALNSQKQSNASTNHVVRNIQSDISKVSFFH
jgi:chromosome segregation ATPase